MIVKPVFLKSNQYQIQNEEKEFGPGLFIYDVDEN